MIKVVSKLVISTVQMALSKIQGNEDTEWKFAKTELILTYFNAHAKGFSFCRNIWMVVNLTLIRESWKNPKRGTITERVLRKKI